MDNPSLRGRKVTIYPGFDASRYAFYIQGLMRIFGSRNIHYSSKGFPAFHHHCLPIIVGENPGVKIYISRGDGPGYNDDGLEWSDVYAKWTLLAEQVPAQFAAKIIPAGPNFDIRVWGKVGTVRHALRTYLASAASFASLRKHLLDYFQQYWFRLPEPAYVPGDTATDYIFYASTLYPRHPGYNRFRATFIEACLATPGVRFEGGLIRTDEFRVPEYEHIRISQYYSPREWLTRVQRSALGFWAPGDQGAMTLKLAEFMACGKAIICVPIRQEMLPAPLVHGEHVHFVDGSLASMKEAIRVICGDQNYRKKLERNARAYYDQFVKPEQAVRRFINATSNRTGIHFT